MTTRDIICADCGKQFTVERGQGQKAGRWPSFCPPCGTERTKASNRRKQYAWREANPEKWKAVRDREWAKRSVDPEHRRDKREREMQRLYGVSAGEFQRLLAEQDGKCAICGYVPPPVDDSKPLPRGRASTGLNVDHCHTKGHVRGLLCGACNTGLGLFRDDPAVLAAAIEYLKRE